MKTSPSSKHTLAHEGDAAEREFFNVPVAEVETTPDGQKIEYPPLMPAERLVCRLIAKGLFISRYSLEWGLYDALDKSFERLNKIAREKVYEQKPLELVVDGPGTLRPRAGKKKAKGHKSLIAGKEGHLDMEARKNPGSSN